MARAPVLLLALGALSAGPPSPVRAGQDAPPVLRDADGKTWARVKTVLPFHLWGKAAGVKDAARADEEWEREKWDALRLTKAQFAELGEILRDGSPFTTEKARSRTIRVPTGARTEAGAEETLPVRVVVTPEYKPGCGRSFPLVITLHGGPAATLAEAEAAAGTQFQAWNGQLSMLKGIVAAPALTGGETGEREARFLLNLVDALDRDYGVDRDRVLLTGHSWGGILTWSLGPALADRFALLAPFVCAVNPGREHLRMLRALPVVHVQGDRDIDWIRSDGRARRDLLDALGCEHSYRELHGGHELFGGEFPDIVKRLLSGPRRMYAERIERSDPAGRNPSGFWYWYRTGAREFTARLDRARNAVAVDDDEPSEVLLADGMLDLDRPVILERRGKKVFEGRVERSLRFALDHVRATGDRGRVFAAMLDVP